MLSRAGTILAVVPSISLFYAVVYELGFFADLKIRYVGAIAINEMLANAIGFLPHTVAMTFMAAVIGIWLYDSEQQEYESKFEKLSDEEKAKKSEQHPTPLYIKVLFVFLIIQGVFSYFMSSSGKAYSIFSILLIFAIILVPRKFPKFKEIFISKYIFLFCIFAVGLSIQTYFKGVSESYESYFVKSQTVEVNEVEYHLIRRISAGYFVRVNDRVLFIDGGSGIVEFEPEYNDISISRLCRFFDVGCDFPLFYKFEDAT